MLLSVPRHGSACYFVPASAHCVPQQCSTAWPYTHLAGSRRMRLEDGSVSEFDVERTGNPLASGRPSGSSGLLDTQLSGDSLSNSNDRLAGSGTYMPPSLDTYQPPVIAVKTLQPGQTADDEDDI
eukprot:COSAG02_NODE_336_length_24344_cov_63.239101_10_plen_125_part_00